MKHIIKNSSLYLSLLTINAYAVIYGSKHDLSYSLTTTLTKDDGTLCVFCHTPHGSNSNFSGNALWDIDLSINHTTYVVYNKDGVPAEDEVNTNSSKACLSCHDGVSAVNSMFKPIENDYLNSSSDTVHTSDAFDKGHPISIIYDESKASLNPMNGPFGSGSKGYGATWHTPDGSQYIKSVLRSGKIECSSCHDPHLGENATFLRVKSNEKSYLCRGCHAK